MKPVLNVDEIALETQRFGERYLAHMGQIGRALGAERLGCRVTVLPPGKRAFPYHCHHDNDEMFVILSGTGTLRFGGETFPLKAGDVAMCPAGGPETAHQIVNDGAEELRYLAISTMRHPDVMEYPDSGKFGVMVGAPPGGDKARRRLQIYAPIASSVDYWAGEETPPPPSEPAER